MPRTYSFQIHGDPDEKFRQVQQLARAKGVTLTGDSTKAKFSGLVAGSYSRSGSTVTVIITRKPSFISWLMVESMVRNFLES